MKIEEYKEYSNLYRFYFDKFQFYEFSDKTVSTLNVKETKNENRTV